MIAFHEPVMADETMGYLLGSKPNLYLDCTLGDGGHAMEALGRLRSLYAIGLDVDDEALRVAKERLSAKHPSRFQALLGDYRDMSPLLGEIGVPRVDAMLFDLGISSRQVDSPHRGFTYWGDGPLDMRMATRGQKTAADILATWSQAQLAQMIRRYGEERFAGSIARGIVRAREKGPIQTADELVEVVKRSMPPKARQGGGHPARKTFQALRIAVNDEIEPLGDALSRGFGHLSEGGIMVVLSYHSLEDRIVKETFSHLGALGLGTVLTRRPIVPDPSEVERNPRARSAKLRALEKRKMRYVAGNRAITYEK